MDMQAAYDLKKAEQNPQSCLNAQKPTLGPSGLPSALPSAWPRAWCYTSTNSTSSTRTAALRFWPREVGIGPDGPARGWPGNWPRCWGWRSAHYWGRVPPQRRLRTSGRLV